MKEIFKVKLADGETIVQMIGHRVDEYFAWTPPPDPNSATGSCSTLTHIPTGVCVRARVGSLGAAKRIAAMYQEKLKGVNWLTDSYEELKDAVHHKRNRKVLAEVRDYDGKEPMKVRMLSRVDPQDRLAVVLNTKEWAGSEVLRTEEENGELVHYLKHSSGARMRLLAGVSRPCER